MKRCPDEGSIGGGESVKIVEAAPAKVNLALHVTGRRVDGYHLLDMLVVFPDVGDTVTIEEADASSFAIVGPMAPALAAEPPEANLVVRAIESFALAAGRPLAIAATLDKRLPIASGIGGGSADCAATLRALCRLYGYDPASPEIVDMALRLGADVPMCLRSRPLKASGIGESILETTGDIEFGVLIANAGTELSTSSVFRALRQRNNPPVPPIAGKPARAELFTFLRSYTRNDLEQTARALAPAVGETLAALAALPGARLVRMSGSGPTCYALFDDRTAAEDAAALLAERKPAWWLAAAGAAF